MLAHLQYEKTRRMAKSKPLALDTRRLQWSGIFLIASYTVDYREHEYTHLSMIIWPLYVVNSSLLRFNEPRNYHA